jgi:hypothetical protein
MSGAMREKTAADFDLERFVDLFDQALTSDDERVKNALRQLMMMVVLTDDHDKMNQKIGPLRQLVDDVRTLNRRLQHHEEDIQRLKNSNRASTWDDLNKGYRTSGTSAIPGATPKWPGDDSVTWAVAKQKALMDNYGMEISPEILRDLNIKVNSDITKEKK